MTGRETPEAAPHRCHAHGCDARVPPRMFVCGAHWARLRDPLRRAIRREYRPGQERDKRPSLRYMAVQQLAVAELAFRPHDEKAALDAAAYILAAEQWRRRALAAGLGDPLAGLVRTAESVAAEGWTDG